MSIAYAKTYDVERIRADFPILEQPMRGKPLVYLDNGATSLKPQSVIDAEIEYLRGISANIHRGVYELSERATNLFDEAREKVKRFIGASEEGEAVFTKGSTEASNIVAFAWGTKFLKPGDEILTTEVEHHANLIPWQEVSRRTGAELTFVELGPAGEITADAVEAALTDRTRVVAITGMSNVTGFMPPIAQISAAAHARGAIVVVDGPQLVSHYPVNVAELDADFLTFSGHKMCGPTGIGVLYGRKQILEEMDPLLYGGDMIVRVYRDRATYRGVPDKFETGTPNISGAIGLGAAVDYLSSVGMERIAAHEEEVLDYAVERLSAVDNVTLYGPRDVRQRGGILSFNVEGVHPHDVGSILDGEGIAVRTGFHCAQPFMRYLGTPGTVRASFYLYNRREDVDRLVAALARVQDVFG
ncbi:MAG: aminotransferase class V-fold PLP-dependent enzyme [Spirochaetales bacterium]